MSQATPLSKLAELLLTEIQQRGTIGGHELRSTFIEKRYNYYAIVEDLEQLVQSGQVIYTRCSDIYSRRS